MFGRLSEPIQASHVSAGAIGPAGPGYEDGANVEVLLRVFNGLVKFLEHARRPSVHFFGPVIGYGRNPFRFFVDSIFEIHLITHLTDWQAEKGLPHPAFPLCNLPQRGKLKEGSQFYRRVRKDSFRTLLVSS